MNSFLDFREKEKIWLETNATCLLGDVTTLNLTKIEVIFQVKKLAHF